nr:transposase domain-containing protein [Phenylobacterium sp. J426]
MEWLPTFARNPRPPCRGIRAHDRVEHATRFLDDGRVELDTNTVERAIRPLALTRKNSLFAGSEGGAEHWAVLASLIATCKLNGVEPQAYIEDVITKLINGHLQSRLDELLPWAYAPTSTAIAA